MSRSDVADFCKELREVDAMLRLLKKGTKELTAECTEKDSEQKKEKARTLAGEQRRFSSASSWARSTTKKEYPMTKGVKPSPTATLIDPDRAERYVRTRTPQYSFGIKPPLAEEKSRSGEYFTGDYDIKVDSLSTKKRTRVSTISKTARLDPKGFEHGREVPHVSAPAGNIRHDVAPEADGVQEGAGPVPMNVDEDASSAGTDVPKPAPEHPTSGKSYSFGKDKRFSSETKAASPPSDGTGQVGTDAGALLDVEAAARAIRPHTTTAITRPPPTTPRQALSPSRRDSADTQPHVPLSTGKIEVLAYRPRTPNVTSMYPDTKFDKTKVTGDVDLGLPGPGYYNITDSAVAKPVKSHSKPVGVVYYAETKPKKQMAYNAKVQIEQESKASVGPGTYAVDKSYNYVGHRAPVLAVMRDADSKCTPQMQRKLYFEQKARDMREVHDHLKETNISQVVSRTPTVSLAPPKWSEKDPRREKILMEHRLSKMRDPSASKRRPVKVGDTVLGRSFDDSDLYSGSGSLYLSPAKKFSAVEKRVSTGAFMGAEVTARRSTSARLRARPGVMSRIAEDKIGPAAARRFYGPQVPVKWTEDPAALQPKKKRTVATISDTEGSGSGAESPSEDLRQFLAERGNMDYIDADARDTEFTAAYLKSRYSGSLQPKKPAVVMTQPKPGETRNPLPTKLTVEEENFEYLGPQLQPDWLAGAEHRDAKIKSQALRMDLVPGREKVKVHQKGVAEVIGFTDKPARSDPMGPGYYDVNSQLDMAKAAEHAKGLPFSKAIARKDQIGAFGERPEAATELVETGDPEFGDLYFEERLDVDYGQAKDKHLEHKKSKAPQLYVKDRHPAEKPSLDEHLGGTWFEGMADEALKKPAVVDFGKMTGRPAPAEKQLEDDLMEEMVGPVDGEAELDVQDWHPNKAKGGPAYVMQDPKKHPRFPKEKAPDKPFDPDAPLEPLPNYDYLRGKEPVLVNMDKMRGRVDEDSELEEAILQEIEGERPDFAGARDWAADRDRAVRRGGAALSGYKRTPLGVNMDKQVGRADNEPIASAELLAALDDEAPARLVDNPELTAPILRNPKDIRRGDGGGARDWSKLPGRASLERDEDSPLDAADAELLHKEELILDPVRDGTSKHKRLQGGVGWEKGSELPRFAADGDHRVDADGNAVTEEGLLDLSDVDPGKFKKGMQGFGANNGGGVNMGNQVGRPNAREAAAIKAAGFEEDELLLEPGENPMTKRTAVASFGSKGNTAGIEDTNAGRKALKELTPLPEEVVLDPTDKYLQKNVHGGVAMQNKAAKVTRKEENVEAEIRASAEVLKLEPTDADKLVRRNPVLATSMSGKQIVRESRQEALLEAENRKSATSLYLEPTDAASKFRVTGGTSMGNKTTRMTTAAENKAIQDFNLTSTEELKIDPNIRATRVGMPSASALASKEVRIRSSQEELAAAQFDRENEELVLDPELRASSSRRRVKSAATMSNTAERFPSHKQDVVAEETQREIASEELILDPSDAKIRKTPSAAGFPKGGTNRNAGIVKEAAPAAATKKPALSGTNASATKTSTQRSATPSGSSAKRPSAAAAATGGTGGSAKTKTAATTAPKEAARSSSKAAAAAPTEEPGTPVITVPGLDAKAPRAPKNKAVYDNLSPNEMMNMIDLQTEMKGLKV